MIPIYIFDLDGTLADTSHRLQAEWLSRAEPYERARIAGVFEDRDRVVAMWRANGLTCYQVAAGDF